MIAAFAFVESRIGVGEAAVIQKDESAAVYRAVGQSVGYVRQATFDPIQQEQMVLQYVRNHGRIIRKDAGELCRLNEDQASRLLRRLQSEGKLVMAGEGRGAFYTAAS